MAKSSARLQLELAKFQAEEKQREHERQIELMRLEKEVQEAAHKREMEARKHVEEMERIKAQQNIPTNPSNPSPGTTSHPRKFPTYKAGDDTEAFLENFERACLGYNISTDQYMVELRPQLSGPLAEVAAEMPKEHMNKYELFKSKVRVRMGITPEQSRRRFRALRWKPDMSFTRHAYHIVKHWDAWISGASVESPVNLPFLMQMEQFLEGVPEEIERYILDGKPKTVIEAGEIGARWVEVAEKKKTGRSWSGDQKGPPQTTPHYRGPPKAPPTSQRTLQTPYRPTTPFSSNPPRPSDPSAGRCFKCNELGHVKANCPKNPNRLQFIAPESHQRSTGPDTSQIPLERRETVSVGGKKVTAWRDTGAQVSAIHASLVDPNLINPEIQVTIQPFKSNSFNLPTAKLPVQYKGWSGMWTFAVYDDYPIPMLLGEDLANHVKQEDWHPQRQLVVPTKYRAKLLSLAHDHPSGHAGVNRTEDRLGGSFHWEGMGKDVSTYVQSCEVCQRVGKPQDQVKAPLQPLPIIEVPFQRVAVDILGPFPKKTPRGKQYILTFMDFATRWPEAVALSNTRAKSVCQALADIFARVGWPSDILTDAGTNFLAGTMKNLWEAHGVNHLVATPYHHQTNGMVEKFNGTLGAMICKFVNEHSNDWDLVLQQLLVAYRAVPHPSLGFSPFELVYGREVKGPLQLVKQQWEGFTPSPGTNILDFVTNLQNTLRTSLALARENLQDAQKEQKAWYDKHARERSFKVGDQVMVLKALQAHKMEASWEGPFVVQERLGAVNYLIAFPTSNRKPKVYHINSLKPFYSRELKVCQFTAQGGDDAEWPEGVYYEGKCAGGVEEVNLSMTLGRMQRQQIQELCTSYAPTFSATPGLTERAYHSIDTGNAHPIRVQPYRVSPQAKTAIEREIQDMLQMGVIRPSESAWASPVVLVPKPDGEIRFCVDYRKLNAVTRPDNYPMPRTDELLEKLGRAQFISTLDLTKGYWQVPLDESAKERSAFITHLGLYEFNVLPFGLRNAPATFQRLVDGLLAGLGEYAVAYLDDVAIFSDSWADHLEHLQKVLERIREAGLTVKAKKCQIGLNRVTYLGHQVGQGTISPLQAKVDAIQKWPVPKSKKQVQSFLGLAGYYRRFVPHYSQIAAPLTDLTKKKQPNAVQWTGKCQKAFNKLKTTLMSDPVLRAPDFDKPFLVTTDASERGVGAVLMQKGPDQEFHPVVFLSKKLSERESNWSVTEKECYAIVYALEKLRPYVWGRRFHLQTDHAALKWLHTVKETNKKLLRWSLALQDFDFDIQHISGASNKVADALSRESFPESTG
ncbi:unnamed protein product [Lepidochelys kempii]